MAVIIIRAIPVRRQQRQIYRRQGVEQEEGGDG
jgi:hypothetical protein